MQPLLKIQQVPINVEYKTQRAALEHQNSLPSVNMTRDRGGLNIQRTPSQLRVDSYETRASANNKSARRLNQEFAEAGRQAGAQATRAIAEKGNQMMDSYPSKGVIADIATSNMTQQADTTISFMPSVRPEVSIDPGSVSIDYTMDKLTFDWNINHKPQLEYVPGNIEFSVTQYPEVIIEYMGQPIYVPPSADPDYIPEVDTSI